MSWMYSTCKSVIGFSLTVRVMLWICWRVLVSLAVTHTTLSSRERLECGIIMHCSTQLSLVVRMCLWAALWVCVSDCDAPDQSAGHSPWQPATEAAPGGGRYQGVRWAQGREQWYTQGHWSVLKQLKNKALHVWATLTLESKSKCYIQSIMIQWHGMW